MSVTRSAAFYLKLNIFQLLATRGKPQLCCAQCSIDAQHLLTLLAFVAWCIYKWHSNCKQIKKEENTTTKKHLIEHTCTHWQLDRNYLRVYSLCLWYSHYNIPSTIKQVHQVGSIYCPHRSDPNSTESYHIKIWPTWTHGSSNHIHRENSMTRSLAIPHFWSSNLFLILIWHCASQSRMAIMWLGHPLPGQ